MGGRPHFRLPEAKPSSWTMEQAEIVFKNLPAAIESLGLSLTQIAASMNVNRRSLDRWLSGKGIRFDHACRLAAVLQTKANFLKNAAMDEEEQAELQRIRDMMKDDEEERRENN